MSHDMSEVKLTLITLLSKVINYEYSPLTGYAYRGVRNLVPDTLYCFVYD